MKTLLFHGYTNTPGDHWYPWLKSSLESKGVECVVPALPGGKDPKYLEWKKAALDVCEIDKNTVVVGHSLGTLLALRLAEEFQFEKLVLVSGWDFNSLSPFEQSFWAVDGVDESNGVKVSRLLDHTKIRENVGKRIIVTSNDDPWITAELAKEMSQRLDAQYELIPGAKHFRTMDGFDKFVQLLDIILEDE